MPFGSRPSRDMNKRLMQFLSDLAVTNAFRQSSLSGLRRIRQPKYAAPCVTNAFRQSSLSGLILSAVAYITTNLSPMPFGSRPSRDQV